MKQDTLDKTIDIIQAVDNPNIKKEVLEIKLDNPMESLGKDLIGFFSARLKQISDIDDLKVLAKEKLIDRLQNDPKVSFSEIKGLLVSLTEQETLSVESILSLLRPTPNATSPILSAISREKNNTVPENADPETQRKADQIFRLLLAMDVMEQKKN